MQRTVTMSADLNGDALADLKRWLGITRPNEDAQLTDLLGASLAMCEAFTGQSPIEQTVEEQVSAKPGCYTLSSRPVRSLIGVQLIDESGNRSSLDAGSYDFQIDAAQTSRITMNDHVDGSAIAVSIRAGIAPDWSTLPQAIKQGIIRLAAFHYRDRETGRDATPPASVTALWRPWRIVRLT